MWLRLGRWWRSWEKPSSPLLLSTLRATVALTLAIVLILLKPFEALIAHPFALNSTILVIVVGQPGKTVGGCAETVLLGSVGLLSGALCFYVLAQIAESPVAQAFVFAFYVYLAALVRAGGSRFISFYLYGVLFAFEGIYTSITNGGRFIPSWFLAYFQSYAFGLIIVIFVNSLIFPTSSETELRRSLITSLRHVGDLAHLTCKTHTKDIQSQERVVRDLLIHSIREDHLTLNGRLGEVKFEVKSSRWSLKDFELMIEGVKGLQQALITSSSALQLINELDPHGLNNQHLLTEDILKSFADFRHCVDSVISEIVEELAGSGRKGEEAEQSPVMAGRVVNKDEEANTTDQVLESFTAKEIAQRINVVSMSLRQEVQVKNQQKVAHRHRGEVMKGASPAIRSCTGLYFGEEGILQMSGQETKSPDKLSSSVSINPIPVLAYFRQTWEHFARAQADAIVTLIKNGFLQVGDELRIEAVMPSMQAMYAEQSPKTWSSALVTNATSVNAENVRRRPPKTTSSSGGNIATGRASHEVACITTHPKDDKVPCSEALTKSYSLLFGLSQLTEELCGIHSIVKKPRKKRLRFYMAERLRAFNRSSDEDFMSLQSALAALRGEDFVPPPESLIRRLIRAEKWLRSDRSLYALKVAIGTTIYTVLLLSPVTRQALFIKYDLRTSLITVIVAIAPTMGQTLSTWVLQMLGTGIGSLYGLAILEIFRNVGIFAYNPYGLAVATAIWAAATSLVFYSRPQYYTGALLLMTGMASMFVLEWEYNELPGEFTSTTTEAPPLRAAYQLTAMCISIVISAVLQLLVFRSPARRQLRLQIARVTFALSSYNTLLQSHINTVAPIDEAPIPPKNALLKIERELIKREAKIQSAIIALSPLYEYARAEPKLAAPFKGEVLLNIIRSHQIILDRLREARTSVGITGFNDFLHKNFASKLFPYRLHSQRLTRSLFYLGATSLLSRTPLPRDVPSSRPTWVSFENDALVLSRRLSCMPGGEEELRQDGFLRYWFYLVALGSVSSELEILELLLGELFGLPEETNPNIR